MFCEEKLLFRKVGPCSFYVERNPSCAHLPQEEAGWCREGVRTVACGSVMLQGALPRHYIEQAGEREAPDGSFFFQHEIPECPGCCIFLRLIVSFRTESPLSGSPPRALLLHKLSIKL